MQLEKKSLRETINKAFLKETVNRSTVNYFKSKLGQLLANIELAEKKVEYEEEINQLINDLYKINPEEMSIIEEVVD